MKKFLSTILICLCVIILCASASREVYLSNKAQKTVEAFSSSASSYYLLETKTNTVLAKSHENDKRKNASTTKIITCITAIENFNDLEQIVKVPNASVGVEGSSIYLRKNQEIKFIDLLYGLMLRSGNDAASAIAHIVAGGENEFAVLMNETAKKAGATNSNFVNPHGLDNENHYTTAEDLAKITAYALKNETFKQITKTSMHKTSATATTEPQFFYNKNKILHMVDGAIGVKTGYTTKAGRCLVSAAEQDDMQVVCVVLNCGPMFEESAKMLKEAFNKYSVLNLEFDNVALNVNNAAKSSVECYVDGKLTKLLTKKDAEMIDFKTTFNELNAPIAKDVIVGKVEVFLKDELLATFDIKTCEEIKEKEVEQDIIDIIKDLVN